MVTGRANFYFKAMFADLKRATTAVGLLRSWLNANGDAFKLWEAKRNTGALYQQGGKLLAELKKKYPQIRALSKIKAVGEPVNELAGVLIDTDQEIELKNERNLVFYSANVWHMSNWNSMIDYAFDIGAISAGWISDEYANFYDGIQLISRNDKQPAKLEGKKNGKHKK